MRTKMRMRTWRKERTMKRKNRAREKLKEKRSSVVVVVDRPRPRLIRVSGARRGIRTEGVVMVPYRWLCVSLDFLRYDTFY